MVTLNGQVVQDATSPVKTGKNSQEVIQAAFSISEAYYSVVSRLYGSNCCPHIYTYIYTHVRHDHLTPCCACVRGIII